jgi:hypothetical protein
VAESSERLAAGAHPLLDARPCVRAAAGHPDVFPRDPLFSQDPIFNSIPDSKARERLIARFDLGLTQPEWALGFEWDIVLRGTGATALERAGDHR